MVNENTAAGTDIVEPATMDEVATHDKDAADDMMAGAGTDEDAAEDSAAGGETADSETAGTAEERPGEAAAAHETAPLIHFAGEEGDTAPETPLIRRLREQVRDLTRQVRSQPRVPFAPEDAEPAIPARPTLETCEHDPDRFEKAMDAWIAARDHHADWSRRQEERGAARRRAEEDQARSIEQQRKALGVPDYAEQAARVKDALNEQQLAILVAGADNPAQLIYALGRSSTRLDGLAAIHDLAKFAVTIGKVEKDIKVTQRATVRNTPHPETRVRGASASGTVAGSEKTLNALEKEAERTGDRSRVIAYKRQMRQQGGIAA